MANQGADLPISSGALTPQGEWNANTNTPTLISSVGVEGNFYIVSVAGTTNLDGISDWAVNDWAVFLNGVWNKSSNEDDHKVLVDGADTVAGYLDEETLDSEQITKVVTDAGGGDKKIEYQLTTKTQPFVINRAPLVTDDETTGLFTLGQTWLDTSTNIVYFAQSLSTGAANWPRAQNTFIDIKASFDINDPSHLDNFNGIFLHLYSAGIADGCAITDNGNGTISIASGAGFLRPSASGHVDLYTVAIDELLNIALADGAANYVSLNWNGGAPTFTVSTSVISFNKPILFKERLRFLKYLFHHHQ